MVICVERGSIGTRHTGRAEVSIPTFFPMMSKWTVNARRPMSGGHLDSAARRVVRAMPSRDDLHLLCVVIVLAAMNRLRSPRLIDLTARALAALGHRVSRRKRARMEQSVSEIFGPSLAPAERARIVRGAFHTFWDETLSFVPWRSACKPQPEVLGLEHLRSAMDTGNGAILWESGCFGRRNIAKQALRQHGFRLQQVHSEAHRAGFAVSGDQSWLLDRVILAYLARRECEFTEGVITLPRSDSLAFTRELLARLRRNQILCVTADVAMGRRLVALQLLGATKYFATGMVTLSRMCKAPLLPLFCIRDHGGRIKVIVEPPIEVPSEGGREAVVELPLRKYSTLLEGYIRRYPDQYRNWHFPWWEPT